jgi:hypothetical protein
MSTDIAKAIVAGSAAAALTHLALAWYKSAAAASSAAATADISTTSSSHSGNVYETNKAVAEYLMFHFGAQKDILPYENGPKEALDFAVRCVGARP